MKKLNTILNHPIISGSIAGVIGGATLIIAPLFISINSFTRFITFPIPLFIAIILLGLLIILFFSKVRVQNKKTDPKEPDYVKNFTSAKIGANNIFWTWDYFYDKNYGKWFINHLKPCCPVCKTPMRNTKECMEHPPYHPIYKCPKCALYKKASEFPIGDELVDVEYIIVELIKEWRIK